ncbi:hypothetical protein SCLARK_00545 [Spiroplasma clarkii]|nr:hypothetical protein SCLARK_00545 [Spiroplasma clarkii]
MEESQKLIIDLKKINANLEEAIAYVQENNSAFSLEYNKQLAEYENADDLTSLLAYDKEANKWEKGGNAFSLAFAAGRTLAKTGSLILKALYGTVTAKTWITPTLAGVAIGITQILTWVLSYYWLT